ncbi:MAG: ATP synthase F0 subunit B [Pyrinomonadaceae bacterium]
MFAFINFLALFASEQTGGLTEFYNNYLNYPGFEAWKFVNLFIFVAVLIYLLKKPLSSAFKTKRETIRQELVRAKAERDAALQKLGEVEARLSNLEAESVQIKEQSAREADAEATRIAAQTNTDVEKLRDNARREIEAASAQAKRELKRFSADASIKLAEEMLRQNLKGDDASRLVNASISGLGSNNGVNDGGVRQ